MTDISIIIVNYNTKNLLDDCLKSVLATAGSLKVEIIVIDNASTDGSVEMLKEKHPSVVAIVNQENIGFARANNQGLKLAQGRYFLLLNTDTLLLDGCLANVLACADKNPSVGIIGCRVLNRDGSLQFSCYRHPNFFTELVFYTKSIIIDWWDPFTWWKRMEYWDHKQSRRVDSVSGCFFMIRPDVYKEIGGLDEKVFMYYEDAEYCRRMQNKTKWSVFYCPSGAIVHFGGGSSAGALKKASTMNSYKGALYYLETCYSDQIVHIFKLSCYCIWQIERKLFSLLCCFEKFRLKVELLSELMRIARCK